MTTFTYRDVTVHYEQWGSGYPLLTLAPGGFNSSIEIWSRAAIDPLVAFADDFRVIGMDQRNAGSSSGPFDVVDPWGSFVDDQLALVDHLGIERFLVMGCCIGCSYALKLAERVPDRIAGAVLEQPIGITEENRVTWQDNCRAWVRELVDKRADLDEATGDEFGDRMWKDKEFVISVSRDAVSTCAVPLLVLPGNDVMHPPACAHEIARLAPDVTLIDPWKDTAEHVAEATSRIRDFLRAHAGTR